MVPPILYLLMWALLIQLTVTSNSAPSSAVDTNLRFPFAFKWSFLSFRLLMIFCAIQVPKPTIAREFRCRHGKNAANGRNDSIGRLQHGPGAVGRGAGMEHGPARGYATASKGATVRPSSNRKDLNPDRTNFGVRAFIKSSRWGKFRVPGHPRHLDFSTTLYPSSLCAGGGPSQPFNLNISIKSLLFVGEKERTFFAFAG